MYQKCVCVVQGVCAYAGWGAFSVMVVVDVEEGWCLQEGEEHEEEEEEDDSVEDDNFPDFLKFLKRRERI